MNYYKEEIELMWQNFERERKDSEESFKAEMMCKMEGQKRDLEETVAKYWAIINSLKEQKWEWSLQLEERLKMEQGGVGQQHMEEICHPEQQLDQRRNKDAVQGQTEPEVWHHSLSGAKEEIRGASPAHTTVGWADFSQGWRAVLIWKEVCVDLQGWSCLK